MSDATIRGWHGDPALKEATVAEMVEHQNADRLVQGYGYWQDGKGCAVGCLIKSDNHVEYEERFGIPEWLAWMEDKIFEGLPKEKAQQWPVRFLSAIPVGADFSGLKDQLSVARLKKLLELADTWDESYRREVVDSIQGVIDALENDGDLGAAESAAWSAARSAAWAAAESAAWAAAESAAWSAAWSDEADRLIAALEALPAKEAVKPASSQGGES
ncbi:MAG: hypothetical protein J0H98_08275 [Solirubrobacterales bacterium]|nr:hypothetical protein [Solirubrobacterales bacterium]